MRSVRWTRPAALLAATAAAAGATVVGLGPALAAPDPVAVDGAVVVSGGTALFTYTLTVSGPAIAAATFTTDQDQDLPADDASVAAVRVDRAATTHATRTGKDLTVDLGAALTPGTHTVSFPVRLPTSGAPRATSNTASVTAAGTTYASAPVTVAINSPDLTLAYDDPDDQQTVAYAGLGNHEVEVYDVANAGTAAVQAQLRLSLPTGLELDEDGVALDDDGDPGQQIPCVPDANDLVCALGTISPGAQPLVIDVSLLVTAAGTYNSRGTYTATVETQPGQNADPDLSDNVVTYSVLFTGEADLTMSATPSAGTVAVGSRTTVTLRIANAGPHPALFATGLVVTGSLDDTSGTPGTVISFDGNEEPPSDYPQVARSRAALTRNEVTHHLGSRFTAHADSELFGWYPGNVQAGRSGVAHLVVQGVRPGKYLVGVLAFSAAGNPSCDNDIFTDDLDPCVGAVTTITVVAAPVHRPGGTGNPIAGGNPNGTGSGLANTGSPTLPLTLTGLGLLFAGAVLTRSGRRRAVA